jgi:energy-coupling factor transport system permease protein
MKPMIGAPLFYRRVASPLHATRAGVAAIWVTALTTATLLLFHPLALLATLLAVLGAALAAGVGHELVRSLRIALIIGVPIVLVNVLVSREGLTVFARLGDLGPFGQGNLTLEALLYGAVIALKVTLLILITSLAGLAIDPDEVLRVLRRLSFRSALTASLATRMLPLLAADAQRLADAQRTRPHGAPRGARGRVALLGAVIGGSLDRAMDVAATLEVRGFATARRAPRIARPWSRHDLAFVSSAVAIVAVAVLGWAAGADKFSAYPSIYLPIDTATLALSAALIVCVLLPFIDRWGIDP